MKKKAKGIDTKDVDTKAEVEKHRKEFAVWMKELGPLSPGMKQLHQQVQYAFDSLLANGAKGNEAAADIDIIRSARPELKRLDVIANAKVPSIGELKKWADRIADARDIDVGIWPADLDPSSFEGAKREVSFWEAFVKGNGTPFNTFWDKSAREVTELWDDLFASYDAAVKRATQLAADDKAEREAEKPKWDAFHEAGDAIDEVRMYTEGRKKNDLTQEGVIALIDKAIAAVGDARDKGLEMQSEFSYLAETRKEVLDKMTGKKKRADPTGGHDGERILAIIDEAARNSGSQKVAAKLKRPAWRAKVGDLLAQILKNPKASGLSEEEVNTAVANKLVYDIKRLS